MSEELVRSFSEPDDIIEAGRVRSDILSLVGITVARDTHQPGWRWSVDVRPLVGTDTCQVRHVGIALQGRLDVVIEDHTRIEIGAGDVFHIPPGHDAWVVGDEPYVSVEWVGARSWITPLGALADRVLSTLVVTDIVDSTGVARRMGDRAWGELLAILENRVRDTLAWFRGQEIKQTGDGVLATFDGAARALRCALELRTVAAALDLPIRAAVHTGEIEVTEDDIHGLAVHEATRMLDFAGPGEILASATTRSLSGDPGLVFAERGEHVLRGIEGPRLLYSVEAQTGSA